MDSDDARTLWCGNLSERVTEDILYELFLQGGPIQKICIPKDRDGRQRTYGFVTYKHIHSVPYALNLFEGTMLYNRPLSMKLRNNAETPQKDKTMDVINNMNHMLQLGQQMTLGNFSPRTNDARFGTNVSCFTPPYSFNESITFYKDDGRHRRMHPYDRDRDRKRDRDGDRNTDRERNRERNYNDYYRDERHNRNNSNLISYPRYDSRKRRNF